LSDPKGPTVVTGASGMLGQAVVAECRQRGIDVHGLSHSDLDICDREQVRMVLSGIAPAAVINCAAYTRVDDAEASPDEAMAVNADAARNLADACDEAGAHFVYISTDYVFDGRGTSPYPPDAPIAPINAYGRSKAQGEALVRASNSRWLIVRTSWLYGKGGPNFVDAIVAKARVSDRIQVVNDQVGRPTWSRSLAAGLLDLLATDARGIHHYADEGVASWFEFAQEIVDVADVRCDVEPVRSDVFRRPAPRPSYSVLDLSATRGLLPAPPPHWRESLRRYLAESSAVVLT
jgi:dTDP-4-dehydrorhamnose reductase